jgi:hypothetical protein
LSKVVVVVLVIAVAAASCSRATADLREWRPRDHDRSDERDAGARQPAPGLR